MSDGSATTVTATGGLEFYEVLDLLCTAVLERDQRGEPTHEIRVAPGYFHDLVEAKDREYRRGRLPALLGLRVRVLEDADEVFQVV